MSDHEENLVVRRSRRSTAGNRMEAALAEILAEDPGKDVEEDIDFVNDKEEEDIFESDFESTDEELTQQDTEAVDKLVQDEEKQARKAARVRQAKATALAHSRQKVTFLPHTLLAQQGDGRASSSSSFKVKRRVSLGFAVDVETGEVIEGVTGKRQSQRTHTVINTSETVSRLKQSEAKRAAAPPKKTKTQIRALTQDELIARALDNEEGNIVDHRDYLRIEEERRKRARVVRATIDGPLIRWLSRAEIVTVPIEPPPPLQASGASAVPTTTSSQMSSLGATPLPPTPPLQLQVNQPSTTTEVAPTSQFSSNLPSIPPPAVLMEKVAKNYVVHELGQFDTVPQPMWRDTMEAMFGDHVQWEDLRVFVGKNRPLGRPKRYCPITGRLARYMDPMTRIPFADIPAYRTIQKILSHEYVWSEGLGCYVSHQDTQNAAGLGRDHG